MCKQSIAIPSKAIVYIYNISRSFTDSPIEELSFNPYKFN